MGADRADLRRGFSHHDMSAVAALPNLDTALFEDFLRLNVMQLFVIGGITELFIRHFFLLRAEDSCRALLHSFQRRSYFRRLLLHIHNL